MRNYELNANLRKKYRKLLAVVSVVILIFSDQFLKYIIRRSGGFYICNKNLAFGLPFFTVFVCILFFILIIIICNFKFKIFNLKLISNFKFKISNYARCEIIAAIFIISGALSNILDRIMFGCVTDFINLHFWPVFNLADVYITIGSGIILFDLFRQSKNNF